MSLAPLNDRINVTPLADVMLVLLIIFMVVTPMLGPGVDVGVPEADYSTQHPGDDRVLVVSVRRDGGLLLNAVEVDEVDLFPALSSSLARRADKIVYVQANELLDYSRVLAVLDICRRAGAVEIALVTRERRT